MPTYEEWEVQVPEEIRSDSLWKMKAYRLALYLGDLAWEDCTILMRDRRTHSLAGQLYEAVGSVEFSAPHVLRFTLHVFPAPLHA